MLKYLAILVVVFGLTFYVHLQEEHAYHYGPPKTSDGSHAIPTDAQQRSPIWYGFFRWPDGTTTWVIVLTLAAIAEQTYETRRSVLVNVRPKLVIRGIEVLPLTPKTDDTINSIVPHRHIKIGIANAGGSDARVTESNLTLVREVKFSDGFRIVLPAFPPYDPSGASFGVFTLRAGEHAQRTIQLDDNMSFTLMLREAGGGSPVVTGAIYCFGFLGYKDKLDINRRTGFAFRYNISDNRFTRMDNLDYNYND